MLKKIFITIFFMFVLITPISANYPASAYQVPWGETDKYVIIEHNNSTYAVTTTTNFRIHFASGIGNVLSWLHITPYQKRTYLLNNGTWSNITNLSTDPWRMINLHANGDWRHVRNEPIIIMNTNTIKYSNINLTLNTDGSIVFPKAPFQLPLTPQQVREGATLEALNQLIHRILTDLSAVLPVGLLVLSLLLAIPLVKRWKGFLRL